MVDRYLGAANKNIGDAFLVIWKIDQDKYKIDENDNSVVYHDFNYINFLVDMAAISFVRI